MEAVSSSNSLNDNWNLYYHLPQDKQWDLSSYKLIMGNIDTVEKLIAVTKAIPDHTVQNCMLFVMRNGITPTWEDPMNRSGGCFSFKILMKQVAPIWKTLLYLLCGETLLTDSMKSNKVTGVTISPKKNFSIVKIWLSDCAIQDTMSITNIPNLSKHGCLFKKHEPEY